MNRKEFEEIKWDPKTGLAENKTYQPIIDEFLLAYKVGKKGNLSLMKHFVEDRLGERWIGRSRSGGMTT